MLDVYIVGDDMNQEISRSILNSHQPMNRQIIKIEDPYMKLDVYWIFFRAGGRDILLSKKNKHTFYELQSMLDGFICQTVEKENIHNNHRSREFYDYSAEPLSSSY